MGFEGGDVGREFRVSGSRRSSRRMREGLSWSDGLWYQ